MKKLSTLIIFIFLIYATNVFGAVNSFWSAQQDTDWTALKDDGEIGHKFWQYVVNRKGTQYDENLGINSAIYYLITGSNSDAVEAWQRVNWYAGRTYNTEGWIPSKNDTRHRFVRMSLLYSYICEDDAGTPAAGATNCANFKDVLNFWTDLCLNDDNGGPWHDNHGTRASDSDETIGHYFGMILFAYAIRSDDLTRSDYILNYEGNMRPTSPGNTYSVGGIDADQAESNSLRNAIEWMFELIAQGEWIESSQYNLNTLTYALIAAKTLNDYFGVDYFPEITGFYEEFADTMKAQITPDRSNVVQWGDTSYAENLMIARRVPNYATLATLDNDDGLRYLFDQLWQNSNQLVDHWLIYAKTGAGTEPTGLLTRNNPGIGTTYFKDGFSSNDSLFWSHIKGRTWVDHEKNGFDNFNLYRQGGWAIHNPKGYFESAHVEGSYMNGLLASGAFPSSVSEAREQTASKIGTDYSYHVGTAGGLQTYSGYYNPPHEHLREYTPSIFYKHTSGGHDIIVNFDRVNGCNPTLESCLSTDNFQRYAASGGGYFYNLIVANSGKHYYIMHSPSAMSRSGDRFTWTAENGETVYWDTQIPSYDYDTLDLVYDGHDCGLVGGTFNESQCTYQTRLISTSNAEWQTFLNSFVVGVNPTVTELSSSGEDAEGLHIDTGDEETVVIFNGTSSIGLTGTPSQSNHNYNRLNELKDLRYFQTSFSVTIPAGGDVDVFIGDLDPALTWNYTIDGGASTGLSVDASGLARFTLSDGVGSKVLAVISDGSPPPTCSSQCSECSTEGDCTGVGPSCNWCNGDTCQSDACDAVCDNQHCDLCTYEVDCNTASCTWCPDESPKCQLDSCPVPSEFGGISDADCLAYYNFNESAGDLLDICSADSTSNDGTISSITTRTGDAYDFEFSSDDYISVAHEGEIDFADEDFTICTKVNFEDHSGKPSQSLFHKGHGQSGGDWYEMYITGDVNEGLLIFQIGDGSSTCNATLSPHTVTAGEDHYICGVRDTSNSLMKLSLDGVFVDTGVDDCASISGQNSKDLLISGWGNSSNYPVTASGSESWIDGTVDVMFIFGRALSELEIQQWIDGDDEEPPVDPPASVGLMRGCTMAGFSIE